MRQILSAQVEREATAEGNTATPPSVMLRLRHQDPQMPDRVCLDNLIVMHRIATGNVSSLLGWLLYRWGTESDIVAEVRATPAGDSAGSLRTFLLETLRTSQSEYLYRRVAHEFEFEGWRFPQGWLLRGCVWESHRTSAVIAEPEGFRLRQEPLAYDRRHFTPLGMGAHACNGGDINELICLTFLEELRHASHVRVVHGEPLQRQTRHWSHWQPNQALRVTVELGP
jgi:cytochrome P450